ncbi:MAG: hypothetical protein JWQ21_3521 [Herminiimonas sp.]|nr:hypothetical protein [Herminiimonas sp.]
MAAFKAADASLDLWRAVEAQHRISTMVLVDTLDEQALLENILDASKPALQADQNRLHWLLFTPFRYPPLPSGSRFRGPTDPGVFYGAESRETACAELGYWRWRFLIDSPDLNAIDPMPQTLFKTPVSGLTIDLRQPPLSKKRTQWTDPVNHAHCQQLAQQARNEHIRIIRYESVRDPRARGCAAVLSHAAFAASKPSETETWNLAVFKHHVFWRKDSVFDNAAFEFDADRWRQ